MPSVEAEHKSLNHLPLQKDLLGPRGGTEATGIETLVPMGRRQGNPWRSDMEGQESPKPPFLKFSMELTNLLWVMPSVYGILGNAKKRHCISGLGKGE